MHKIGMHSLLPRYSEYSNPGTLVGHPIWNNYYLPDYIFHSSIAYYSHNYPAIASILCNTIKHLRMETGKQSNHQTGLRRYLSLSQANMMTDRQHANAKVLLTECVIASFSLTRASTISWTGICIYMIQIPSYMAWSKYLMACTMSHLIVGLALRCHCCCC